MTDSSRRTSPAGNALALDALFSDTVDLVTPTRALYVGVTGNIKVIMEGGQTVTLENVPVCVIPLRVQRIFSTGTDASKIVGLW